jgi:hypothetical protein
VASRIRATCEVPVEEVTRQYEFAQAQEQNQVRWDLPKGPPSVDTCIPFVDNILSFYSLI